MLRWLNRNPGTAAPIIAGVVAVIVAGMALMLLSVLNNVRVD